MIRLQEPDQLKPTEFAPAMDEGTGILPGLPPVASKPVHLTFDGGLMTSDAGILLLAAIEQRLGIAERLADCIEDRRDPDRVLHGLAEMIRYRAMLIAAGYPDGNDCDALRSDPAFKMAVGRLPESGDDLCSQPSISRLENLPGPVALKRMMAAMVELFCDSFGDCQEFRARLSGLTDQPMAAVKRSPKRTANCDLAMDHSRGGMIHSFSERFKTRKRSLVAASSLGKWPLARTARRSLAFSASIAFVV